MHLITGSSAHSQKTLGGVSIPQTCNSLHTSWIHFDNQWFHATPLIPVWWEYFFLVVSPGQCLLWTWNFLPFVAPCDVEPQREGDVSSTNSPLSPVATQQRRGCDDTGRFQQPPHATTAAPFAAHSDHREVPGRGEGGASPGQRRLPPAPRPGHRDCWAGRAAVRSSAALSALRLPPAPSAASWGRADQRKSELSLVSPLPPRDISRSTVLVLYAQLSWPPDNPFWRV